MLWGQKTLIVCLFVSQESLLILFMMGNWSSHWGNTANYWSFIQNIQKGTHEDKSDKYEFLSQVRMFWNMFPIMSFLLYLQQYFAETFTTWFNYCQAQPQFQLQLGWVSCIIDFPHQISCATTTRASSEIAGNEQNLLINICRSTLVELKTIGYLWKNGRRPSWITTMKDDIDGFKFGRIDFYHL